MVQERRANRSNYRDQALCLQPAACAASGGLDAMVLSDDCGLLVASSPLPRTESERLASRLPDFVAAAGDNDVVTHVVPDGRRLVVRGVKLGQERLSLGALGRSEDRGVAQLGRALSGVCRILSDVAA